MAVDNYQQVPGAPQTAKLILGRTKAAFETRNGSMTNKLEINSLLVNILSLLFGRLVCSSDTEYGAVFWFQDRRVGARFE